MRELTACGSCEFVWLDSFDSFIVAVVVPVAVAAANADADADANADVAGNGAAAAHVWPKYKKAILATLSATLATCCCYAYSPSSSLVCSASSPSSSAVVSHSLRGLDR